LLQLKSSVLSIVSYTIFLIIILKLTHFKCDVAKTAQRLNGSTAQWLNGTMAQWLNGSTAQRLNGTMAQWLNGSMAQWLNGKKSCHIV
jgi:hypothetical protein